jgi:hypothetical protein
MALDSEGLVEASGKGGAMRIGNVESAGDAGDEGIIWL